MLHRKTKNLDRQALLCSSTQSTKDQANAVMSPQKATKTGFIDLPESSLVEVPRGQHLREILNSMPLLPYLAISISLSVFL